MGSTEYQINIKSANQKVDDYVTKCESDWTVNRLKQHISETHINKPNIEDQRLIYAGNLLKDSQTLKQVFFRDSLCTDLTNSSKTDFTIHLVCTQKIVTNQVNRSSNITSRNTTTRPQGHLSSSVPHAASSAQSAGDASTIRPSPAFGSGPSTSNTRPVGGQQASNQGPATNSNINPTVNDNPFSNLFTNLNSLGSSIPNPSQREGLAHEFMQSEQIRQKMARFEQLANAVAVQLTILIANNSNFNLTPDLSASTTPEQLSQMLNPTAGEPIVQPTAQGISTSPLMATPTVPCQTSDGSVGTGGIDTNRAAAASSGESRVQGLIAAVEERADPLASTNHTTASSMSSRPAAQIVDGANADRANPIGAEPAQPVPQFAFQVHQAAPQPAPPVVEQQAPNHDVIDWIYYSIRAIFIMTALYMHASIFRLLSILGLLVMAYFVSRRVTRRTNANRREVQVRDVRDPNQNQQNLAQQQPAQQAADRDANEPDNRARDGGIRHRGQELRPNANDNNTNSNDNRQGQDEAAARVPFLKLCYLVVTDFIASLVPN